MIQIAFNVTDCVDRFFEGKRYLIHNRDPFYTQQFLNMLGEAGIESVKLRPRAPNLKRIRGALRKNYQGSLFGSDDFLW